MKKFILLYSLVFSLQATTVWVSASGNDSNNGTQGSPWLTLNHAVGAINCGDTINVVAGLANVAGDFTFRYFLGCALKTTIQSSAFSQFAQDGFRTNPTNDANIYGNLVLTTGISWAPEFHGSNIGEYGNCGITSIVSNVITVGTCTQLPNAANGTIIEMELDTVNAHPNENLASAFPIGLTALQHYKLANCSSSPACGTTGSSFSLTDLAGNAITIGSCLVGNGCYLTGNGGSTSVFAISEPIQVTANSSTFTSPDAFVSLTNGSPVFLSSVGMQLFGTMPVGILYDTIYYLQNISGRNFNLSTDLAGNNLVTPTTSGTGPLMLASANAPHDWILRGLKFFSNTSSITMVSLGNASETSMYGMMRNIEISHSYFTDDPTQASGPTRAISDNIVGLYLHDNYCAGMRTGESQCLSGYGSPGPTVATNNFFEAATEIVLYGGNGNSSGVSNANKLFQGNYFYKPPTWKIDASAGFPTVNTDPCVYDTTDPLRSGGEWHTDTNTSTKYRCQANGTWGTTALTVPTAYTIKNSVEFKNGKDFRYIGNLHNYSWANNQSGQCMAFHQNYDSSPGAANLNISAINNKCLNVYYFISAESRCLVTSAFPCLDRNGNNNFPKNHYIFNNVVYENYGMCAGPIVNGVQTNCGFNLTQNQWASYYPETGEYFSHNTIVATNPANLFNGFGYHFFYSADLNNVPFNGTSDSWVYKNNILYYDFQGDGFNGGSMISNYFTHSLFTNNALVYGNAGISYGSPGATNTFTNFDRPASTAAMQFINTSTNDYHLTSGSPHSADCSAGCLTQSNDNGAITDLGADIDLNNMYTANVAAGTPRIDIQAGLKLNISSTQVTFNYNSPGTGTCTVTIYNAPARISANQVTSVSDNSANSISDVTRRNLYINSLTASTHYFYKLNCGTGTLMVGDFYTTASGSSVNNFTFTFSTATGLAYSVNANMSSPTNLSPALTQIVPVNSGTKIYAQPTGGEEVILLGQ